MEVLDLHWTSEEPDLGIASDGILCKDMDEIIARITKVKNTVKKINLDNQHALISVPAVLGECKLLEELNISHTAITEIPDFIFSLPNLQFLSCRCSELMHFPASLLKAENLDKLHFRVNKGSVFPEELSSLKKLRSIAVDLYTNEPLPKNMGDAKGLEKINLYIKYDEGDVPNLPDSFKNHPVLKKIRINDPFYKHRKNFDLLHLTHVLSSCQNLETLKLSGFAVGSGHKGLSALKNLTALELRHLLVDGNIFDSISGLSNLDILDIWGSEFRITEIPDFFANFKKLGVFSFAGNMIKELPPSIYSLENLRTLEIGSTGISSLDEKIGNLKNLEKIHVYDNILEKLPLSVFSLPKLQVLNIEDNIFNSAEIFKLKGYLKILVKKGRKIEFNCEGQGRRQMVKRLRAIKDIEKMDIDLYTKYCINAINENPFAIKYFDSDKLDGTKNYAEICIAAVKRTCFALENIDVKMLGSGFYFHICMEAAKCPDIGNAFNLINEELLSNDEYIQVCLEAALNNKNSDFLENFNTASFKKRYNREIYERLCWTAILHHPPVITKMENPAKDLLDIARKHPNYNQFIFK